MAGSLLDLSAAQDVKQKESDGLARNGFREGFNSVGGTGPIPKPFFLVFFKS